MPELSASNLSVLFVPAASDRVAASRTRAYEYVPWLEAKGIPCRVFPALSDATTKQVLVSPTYGFPRKVIYYARVMIERAARFVVILALSRQYRVVLFQRAVYPFVGVRLLKRLNPNIIFDFDDAIFMADPASNEKGPIGRLKTSLKAFEVSTMLGLSKRAIVENDYLRDYALRYCKDVDIIAGPVDTSRYALRPGGGVGPLVIGWIGSPSTAPFLKMVAPALAELGRAHDIRVRLIGAGGFRLSGVNADYLDWSLDLEARELQGFDIGLMPMPDNEWTRGKLGYKMLQYMSVGAVPIVSYTPTTATAITDGVDGFLIRSPEQWLEKLTLLAADGGTRSRVGAAARRTAEQRFSLQIGATKLIDILGSVSRNGGDRSDLTSAGRSPRS